MILTAVGWTQQGIFHASRKIIKDTPSYSRYISIMQ